METKKSAKADLRSRRLLFKEIGGVLALLVVFLAFETQSARGEAKFIPDDNAAVYDEPDVIPIPLETPPEMPKVAVPVFDDIIIVDDEIKVDALFIDTEDELDRGFDIKKYVPEAIEEESVEEEIPFVMVEDKPSFMGGDANTFSKWVSSQIVYPEICKENGVSGKVMLQFTIDAAGKLCNVKVLREVDPALASEAVRVVSMSPKWEPGRQRGRAVRVSYTFPVQFSLQ